LEALGLRRRARDVTPDLATYIALSSRTDLKDLWLERLIVQHFRGEGRYMWRDLQRICEADGLNCISISDEQIMPHQRLTVARADRGGSVRLANKNVTIT
jgi:hypothetical protein